jgi:hypothetical protein
MVILLFREQNFAAFSIVRRFVVFTVISSRELFPATVCDSERTQRGKGIAEGGGRPGESNTQHY